MFDQVLNMPLIYQWIIKMKFLAWLIDYEIRRLFFTFFIHFPRSLKLGDGKAALVV